MARFTVILPEGSVLLKNETTGETLRLCAESGPLVLGEIDMSMTLAPAPASSAAARSAAPTAEVERESVPASSETPTLQTPTERNYLEAKLHQAFGAPGVRSSAGPEGLVFEHHYDQLAAAAAAGLPPGFGPNEGEPFMAPSEPLSPEAPKPGRGFIRVLDAPLDALTAEDFEETLDAMSLRRNNMEGEIEYLEEIEAEPEDIEELQAEIERLDTDIADVLKRQAEFEALPKKQGLTSEG